MGAHYFEAHTDSNFRVLDVLAAGPIVRQVSQVFDRFWNGDWSVPMAALVRRPSEQKDHEYAEAANRQQIEQDNYPFPVKTDAEQLFGELMKVLGNLIWTEGEVVWDDPESLYKGIRSGVMNEALHQRFKSL